MAKLRVLSGNRVSGKLHIGNLCGAINNYIKLQEDYECFFMIADLHGLTTEYNHFEEIKKNTLEIAIDWLSAGLNPQKCTIFVQSHVPYHAELHLLLSMFIPLSWLERNPTYKEQLKEIKDKNLTTYGFLGYPVLQSADILLYKANFIPVGIDQLPHIELCRKIAKRFNFLYKKIFPLPQAKLTDIPKLVGIDGKKMSKSYNNCIYISDEPEIVKKKIIQMITDPQRIKREDVGHPEVCIPFTFYNIFSKEEIRHVEEDCKKARIGCTECKKHLATIINSFLKEIREKRKKIESNPKFVYEVLEKGAFKAISVAKKTIEEVKNAMGL